MEVYAGFLEFADYHTGRLIDALKQLQVFDDTLIFYIIGDNGASGEGTLEGTFNEILPFNGLKALETTDFLKAHIDKLGSPESYNHYAVGWAHAMDTPYQWTKQIASHWGGTRNGTVIHWPNGIKAKGEIRNQFHHMIDVAPTILEAAQLPEPYMVNSVAQVPMQGVSMLYSFDDAKAGERRETQYFEMIGNRGIYHKGWTAVTRHRTPWILTGKTRHSTMTFGNCTTQIRIGHRHTTWRSRCPKSFMICNACGSSKRHAMAFYPWTIARRSGSTLIWRAVQCWCAARHRYSPEVWAD